MDESNTWKQTQKVAEHGYSSYDFFGQRTAIHQNEIYVTQWGQDKVFVYLKNETNYWSQYHVFDKSNDDNCKKFGSSIAVSANFVIICDEEYSGSISKGGACFVYAENYSTNPLTFSLSQTIMPLDVNYNYHFGKGQPDIIENEQFVIVGSVIDYAKTGSAYIFELDDTTNQYVQMQKLIANESASDQDYFGESVCIDGTTAIVGAHQRANLTGSVYIFELNEKGNWEQTAKLVPNKTLSDSTGLGRIYYGKGVDLYGDLAVVGAPISNSYSGDVYIYRRNENGEWESLYYLIPSDSEQGADFGQNVKLTDKYLIVSAHTDNLRNTSDAGSVYIYQYGEKNSPVADPTNDPTVTMTSTPTAPTVTSVPTTPTFPAVSPTMAPTESSKQSTTSNEGPNQSRGHPNSFLFSFVLCCFVSILCLGYF